MADDTGPTVEEKYLCMGRYGFGAGYHLTETEAPFDDFMLRGRNYCGSTCPLRELCWTTFSDDLKNNHPIEVEDWLTLVKKRAEQMRVGYDVAHERLKAGRFAFGAPDPYTRQMLHWVDQGMEQRLRDDPTVEYRKVLQPGAFQDRSRPA